MNERHENVVNVDEVEPKTTEHGSHRFVRRQLGAPAGAKQLGCSHMELAPGERSWPRHWHAANEEAIYVLEGTGSARIGEASVPIRAGDYVALPVGPAHAHQIVNDGDAPLRYLCFSTMLPTDIGVYPDSKKIGVFGGAAPGGPKEERFLSGFLRADATVGYWDGEG